ncbi:unnamed protein product, partial [Musa textilis]
SGSERGLTRWPAPAMLARLARIARLPSPDLSGQLDSLDCVLVFCSTPNLGRV